MWEKQKFYEFSNKPHRMLVNMFRPCPFHSLPELLIQKDGTPTHCPQTMTKILGNFYRELYNCLTPEKHFHFMQNNFDQFVKDLSLPKLTIFRS